MEETVEQVVQDELKNGGHKKYRDASWNHDQQGFVGIVFFRQSSNESYVIVFSFKYYMDCLYFLAVIPKGIS